MMNTIASLEFDLEGLRRVESRIQTRLREIKTEIVDAEEQIWEIRFRNQCVALRKKHPTLWWERAPDGCRDDVWHVSDTRVDDSADDDPYEGDHYVYCWGEVHLRLTEYIEMHEKEETDE